MISFKGRHFKQTIILMAIRWYIAYPLSYRNIEELMEERGVALTTQPLTAGLLNIPLNLKLNLVTTSSGRLVLVGEWMRHI
jgi:hypothetical protein